METTQQMFFGTNGPDCLYEDCLELPLQHEEKLAPLAPELDVLTAPPNNQDELVDIYFASIQDRALLSVYLEQDGFPAAQALAPSSTRVSATIRPMTEPIFVDTSLLFIDAPPTIQSLECSQSVFQPRFVPESSLPEPHILGASHSLYPFMASRILLSENQFATSILSQHGLGSSELALMLIWPSYREEHARQTPILSSGFSSCSGSQDNIICACFSANTSLSSLSDDICQSVNFETGQVHRSSWSAPHEINMCQGLHWISRSVLVGDHYVPGTEI